MIFARLLCLFGCVLFATLPAFGNGGAWPTGVPATGNAAPSDKARSTEVAIEDENLTIDLHQEFAEVEVRYRMRNAGPKIVQDFFFPVERWTEGDAGPDGDGGKPADLIGYNIKADKTELKWTTIDVPSPKPVDAEATPEETPEPPTASEPEGENEKEFDPDAVYVPPPFEPQAFQFPGDVPPPTRHWKKSEIPFSANQTREIVIRYQVGYRGYTRSASDDEHETDHRFVYSLSPAATWKGAISRGKVIVNVRHPRPEEVEVERPKDQFKKVSDVRYEWEFRDLEPTLADDLKIVARRGYNSYGAGDIQDTGENEPWRRYEFRGERYYLDHADYKAAASSTLPPSGAHKYDVENIKRIAHDLAWSEGAEGDGIGESITLDVTRPLPLDAIMIRPGYESSKDPSRWTKNNRVAELEVTLNGAHTFSVKIPDEKFSAPYPLVVRDFAEPVKTVKLVIKGVHRGTAARDTCVSEIRLKGKIATKPKIQPSR